MTKTLIAPGGMPRLLAPTTTAKLARRMLAASQVVAERLPRDLHGSPAVDILLALHVAEDEARYLRVDELAPAGGPSPGTVRRWIAHLVQHGYVDRRGDVLALSGSGHAMVSSLIEALFVVQRALD